ncbi:neurotrypsin-like [Ctenocephalides felis]|uniref:neurotrypsin-like n=1 Tax=Ctenocephalides felis TaxID=7515 RepID=UPI000E6E5411|nr:neurotrypsin-like [Ctenocephalides felis]
MDDVECLGNETSIRECQFNGWGVHDCLPEEAAGVVCRTPAVTCPKDFWLCSSKDECIPTSFLCDNVDDCADGSDESEQICNEDIEVRLVDGPNKMEGRVEVKFRGIWGTVCDDDFTDKAARVVCNMLGFNGPARARKEGFYGSGSGQIWLDQVACFGNESSIAQCMHWQWGENNCGHSEDVGVVCSNSTNPKDKNNRGRGLAVNGEDDSTLDFVDDKFLTRQWDSGEILPKNVESG